LFPKVSVQVLGVPVLNDPVETSVVVPLTRLKAVADELRAPPLTVAENPTLVNVGISLVALFEVRPMTVPCAATPVPVSVNDLSFVVSVIVTLDPDADSVAEIWTVSPAAGRNVARPIFLPAMAAAAYTAVPLLHSSATAPVDSKNAFVAYPPKRPTSWAKVAADDGVDPQLRAGTVKVAVAVFEPDPDKTAP
jgi:hypothetical protein